MSTPTTMVAATVTGRGHAAALPLLSCWRRAEMLPCWREEVARARLRRFRGPHRSQTGAFR